MAGPFTRSCGTAVTGVLVIEHTIFPISKFGQASILTTQQSSLLALRGGSTSSGVAVGGSIDILGVLMDRMVTLMQLAAVVYAIYLVIEFKKQIDTMKDMVEKRVDEAKEELQTQWDDGWKRHNETMKKVEKRVDEVKVEMKTQWDNGWKRQNKAMNEVKEELQTQWDDGWKRHNETMKEVEKRVDEVKVEMKTQWDDGWKRHNETMKEVEKRVDEVKGEVKTQWDNGWKRQNKVIVEMLKKPPRFGLLSPVREGLIGILNNEVDGPNDEE